jgi:hypothetical protein
MAAAAHYDDVVKRYDDVLDAMLRRAPLRGAELRGTSGESLPFEDEGSREDPYEIALRCRR